MALQYTQNIFCVKWWIAEISMHWTLDILCLDLNMASHYNLLIYEELIMKKIFSTAVILASLFTFIGCAKKTVTINSTEDLVGKKVGCQSGTTGELYLTEELKGVKVQSFKTGIDASLSLKNGAIDALVLDELPAKEIVRRTPELKILDIPFASEEYAIAVRKGDKELLDSVNKTIAALKADGTYEKLVSIFMPVDGSDIIVPSDLTYPENAEVIKMGTNAAFPPFEYVEGTKVVGFDATFAQYIARDYGKKLQIVDMSFDGLIAALQAGSIDFIAAGMTATDERRENVDFSEPYYSSNQVIIVRGDQKK